MSLKKQSISAFFWSSGQQGALLLINLISSIWLARLLNPYEFGLIGMISIFIAMGNVLMTGGFGASIIRSPALTKIEKSTLFWGNFGLGVGIYITIFLCAPFIAEFFSTEVLIPIIRVYSLVIVLKSFSSIHLSVLVKELKLKRNLLIKIPSLLLGAIIGIILALNNFGVWSLVWMYLMSALMESILYWTYSDWKPKLVFNTGEFKKHISFGSRIALSSVLEAFFGNIYNLIIGKFFSVQTLGYFTRSNSLMRIPVYNLIELFDRVTYPILANVQSKNLELRNLYSVFFKIIMLIIIPTLFLCVIIAEPLFRFLLTEKWMPAVPYFQLLCIGGLFIPLGSTGIHILKIKGKERVILRIIFFEKLIVILGLFLVIPFGIEAMLYFQIVANFGAFYIKCLFAGKLLGFSVTLQLKELFKVLFYAFIPSGISWFLVSTTLNYFSDFQILFVTTLIFIISFLAVIFLFEKALLVKFKNNLIKQTS